jgi:hypothetical protein
MDLYMYVYVHEQYMDVHVHLHVQKCKRFLHTFTHIYKYSKISFRFAEFLDEISPKRNETMSWQNEISAKFREISPKFRFVTKQKNSISGEP